MEDIIDKKHIVSFSGGKDSTAMLIKMLELDMRVDRIIFADTKYEYDEMYEYIDKVNDYIKKFGNYEIERVATEDTLERWMFGKVTRGANEGKVRGFPLTIYPCYWSRESKFKILNNLMDDNIRYIGIAVDEKRRMVKNYEERDYKYPLVEWNWTEQDCVDYLTELGIMNPLYGNGITRTGCWWCPKQNLASTSNLINNHPDKWQQLKDWENRLQNEDSNKSWKHDYDTMELERRFKKDRGGC